MTPSINSNPRFRIRRSTSVAGVVTLTTVAVALLAVPYAAMAQNSHGEKDLYDGGMYLFDNKSYPAAEKWFCLAIKADPRYKEAWQALADSLRAEGKTDAAAKVQAMADAAPAARAGDTPPLTAEQQGILDAATGNAAGHSAAPTPIRNTAPMVIVGGPPDPTAAARAATPAAADSTVTVARKLKARPVAHPHDIIGRAFYQDGRPIPQFQVESGGFDGNFQLGGGANTFFKGTGHGGTYALHADRNAMMVSVTASVPIDYQGKKWLIDLWPADNLHNGSGAGDFRGQTAQGIVRDFVFLTSGIKPGFSAKGHPGYTVNGTGQTDDYYGGALYIHCDWGKNGATDEMTTSLSAVYPQGATVTFTLTPTGPLIDGSAGRTIHRSLPLGSSMYLYALPIGAYAATAELKAADGSVHTLRLSREIPQTADKYRASIPVEWSPRTGDEFFQRMIGYCDVYLVE